MYRRTAGTEGGQTKTATRARTLATQSKLAGPTPQGARWAVHCLPAARMLISAPRRLPTQSAANGIQRKDVS
jgi:hypothetical protein